MCIYIYVEDCFFRVLAGSGDGNLVEWKREENVECIGLDFV